MCPLKALLNDLVPRSTLMRGGWDGRSALWHGDVDGVGAAAHPCGSGPDVLLTTPESLEAMLIRVKVDHGRLFSEVRAVVVDEVHAFAGDDRVGICSRFWSGDQGRRAVHPAHRPVGDRRKSCPIRLIGWQGSGKEDRSAVVVSPDLAVAAPAVLGGARPPGTLSWIMWGR